MGIDPLGGLDSSVDDSGCYGRRAAASASMSALDRNEEYSIADVGGMRSPKALAKPPAGFAVVKEKIAASSDSDTSTAQTVAKMCEYIRAGVADDVVKGWAQCAIRTYARGATDARMAVWAVFWLLKHCVKFAQDEPRLFRIGEPGALDLLVAPAVLVRETNPKEDCDGFTMLACALLGVLGLKSYIVTIAADPSDARRWSHVFAVAELPGGSLCPLDASHGMFPGWMVPEVHTFRRQAWTLDGKPVDLKFSPSALHGYRRGGPMGRGGVGDVCYVGMTDPDTGDTVASCGAGDAGGSVQFPWFTGGGGSGGGSVSPTSGKPIDWGSIFSNAISTAGRVAQTAFLPSGVTTRLPNGQIVSNTGSYGAQYLSPGVGSSLLPILGIGLVAVIALGAMGGKKH